MKKNFFIIGLLLMAILAMSVSAASIWLDKTSISKTAKPKGGFSDIFTIMNNGTSNISDTKIQLVTTELSNFNITTTPYSLNQQFALNVNNSVQFTMTGTIPEDITTRTSPYTGTLKIYSGSTELGAIDLKITAESQLKLDNVKFVVDGKSKSIDEGDTRKDVKPGSKLEIKGDVLNDFTDSEDITIEGVTITITIKDIDDGEDLEEDEDIGDIDADDKEGFNLKFEIPEDIDADEYAVEIVVEGDDENGAKHSVEWDDIKIKVEKDKHDIQIKKATVSPPKIDCSRNINVNVDLKNQGESDEDEVVLKIESAALEITTEDTSIPELQEGTGDETEYSKSYSYKIGEKVKPGTYQITVKVYYDTDTLSESKTLDLIVNECVIEEEEEKKEEVVVVTPPVKEEEEPEIITTPITETTEFSLFGLNAYMVFLIAAIGIAVLVITIMVIVLFTIRKRE